MYHLKVIWRGGDGTGRGGGGTKSRAKRIDLKQIPAQGKMPLELKWEKT